MSAQPPSVAFTHLVLVGLPGAGKSTVGRAVAERLGLRFLDLDVVIERRAGRRVWEIFRDLGEDEFRRMEREVTSDVAAERGIVLAPGGGWLANAGARLLLGAGARLVYLEVTPETAATRLALDGQPRPLLEGDPPARLLALLQERQVAYQSAGSSVNTEGMTPQQVTDAVVELVSR